MSLKPPPKHAHADPQYLEALEQQVRAAGGIACLPDQLGNHFAWAYGAGRLCVCLDRWWDTKTGEYWDGTGWIKPPWMGPVDKGGEKA